MKNNRSNNTDSVKCPYSLFNKVAIKNPRNSQEQKYMDNFPLFINVVRKNFYNKIDDWDDKLQEMAVKYWEVIEKLHIDGTSKPFKYLQLYLTNVQTRSCKHFISSFSIPIKMSPTQASVSCYRTVSLQDIIGNDNDAIVEDIIGSDTTEDVDANIDETYNHKFYNRLTASLQPRDKEICLMLLDEHIPKAKRLNYIASRYNITNQRASQIKQRIIRKLKSTVIRKGLTFNE